MPAKPIQVFHRPSRKLSLLVDPTRKVFEGEYAIRFYDDMLDIAGYCWHCKSKVFSLMPFSAGESAQVTKDEQFRKNMADYAVDEMEKHHQCGALIHDNKFVWEDVVAEMGA